MHLVKGLLLSEEIDRLREACEATCDRERDTHAHILIEDGVVVGHDGYELLAPALHERILPYVRARLGDDRVVVADALMRAYRHADRRQALAPHFDVSSYATVIIPLNPGECTGGLYVQCGASVSSRALVEPSFTKGDALVHRFDVMHGVDVSAGDRFSLVLWLSDCAESVRASATPWLRGAAEAGNAYAQFLYAELSVTGEHGVGVDLRRAVAFQTRAAAQGHALSQHRLGAMYLSGRGVEQSDTRCRELWQRAAEAGLAAAQLDLGKCFASGRVGLPQDLEAARQWYERAERQGNAEAAVELRHLRWLQAQELDTATRA